MADLTEAERVLGFSLRAFKEIDVMSVLKSYVRALNLDLKNQGS